MVNDVASQSFYSLISIQELVNQGRLTVVNRRARYRLEDLGWDAETLKDFILALNDGHFLAKYPQCSCGSFNIDCDGYKMRFDENERIEDKHGGIELFIKLAISSNSTTTLIISFHLDGSPG